MEASAVKSRLIASALAAAAGSGIVVFSQHLAARPRMPVARISRAIRLRECRCPLAAQLGMNARRAAAGLLPVHPAAARPVLRHLPGECL